MCLLNRWPSAFSTVIGSSAKSDGVALRSMSEWLGPDDIVAVVVVVAIAGPLRYAISRCVKSASSHWI